MLIDYNFLNAIKDNPEWLKKFVDVHNACEDSYDEYAILIEEHFDSYAKETEYDVAYYNEVNRNINNSIRTYEKFIEDIKTALRGKQEPPLSFLQE